MNTSPHFCFKPETWATRIGLIFVKELYYVRRTIYDASGRVELRELVWNGSSPTVKVDYDYFAWDTPNGQGRLKQIKAGTPASPTSLLDLRYFSGTNSPAYDALGNLLNIYDHKMGSPQTQSFTYDNLDRLTSASASGGTGGIYAESYTYNNDTGNLASKGGVSYYYEDPSHVHAVTRLGNGNTYGYDANGNMTQRNIGGVSYTLEYDAENRLTTVKQGATTIAVFSYDGDGVRVKGTLNGVTTAYVGEILEWTGSTSSMVKYYYAGGTRVAMRNGTTLYWLIGDHLSSTSVVANSTGGLHSKMLYKAWGEVRYASASLPTRYTYTGQYSYMDDPATSGVTEGFGLMFYRSRYYDPYLNRWTSPDSIIPDLHNPFDWDRYSFVRNNPLKYVDPDGHNPLLIIAIIGAAIFFSQIPSDQYQPDPSNRGNPGVALFGLSLMLAPAIAPAACVNDGDCTNEANAAAQVSQNAPQAVQAAQSVWNMNPFARGTAIEKMLGRSPQLAGNFPVIDRFQNGVATSIKSIDLLAKTYQNISNLTRTVQGYVNTLANWQGSTWGDVTIKANEIASRELLLAVPPNPSGAQMQALQQLQQWAFKQGVTLTLVTIK